MFVYGNKRMTRSPVNHQNFVWVAEYVDGTHLGEYDFATGKSNSFYDIERSKVLKFGLIGEGSQVYFDVGNGIFTLNQHRFSMSYAVDGMEYPLTGRSLIYNGLITYKDAVSDAAPFLRGKGAFTNQIVQYNVGYKKKMKLIDVNINFQCLFSIPLNEPAFFQIKISADKDLDGKLLIRRGGLIVDEIDAPLKAGLSGQLNWTIK